MSNNHHLLLSITCRYNFRPLCPHFELAPRERQINMSGIAKAIFTRFKHTKCRQNHIFQLKLLLKSSLLAYSKKKHLFDRYLWQFFQVRISLTPLMSHIVGAPCPISLSNSKLDVPYFSKREANLKIGGSIEGTLNVHGYRRLVLQCKTSDSMSWKLRKEV